MMLRVSGIGAMLSQQGYNSQQQGTAGQVHYYRPEATKEEVKEDFGFALDVEIKKLTIDVLI